MVKREEQGGSRSSFVGGFMCFGINSFLWFSQSLQVAGRGAHALAGVQTLPMAVQTLPMASRGSAVRACVRLLWPAPEGSAPTPRVVYWLAFWDAVKLCSQTEDFHFRNTYS